MTTDEKIAHSMHFLKVQAEKKILGTFPRLGLDSIKQDGATPSEKTAFIISEQNTTKLLYVFNRSSGKCYIKSYYAIPDNQEMSCTACPQEIVECDDLEKIEKAFSNFIESMELEQK